MNLDDGTVVDQTTQQEQEQAVDYQAEAQRLQSVADAAEQRYKSLQGQFDSVQRNQSEMQLLRAQMQDMQSALQQKAQPNIADEPLIDAGLQEFLADYSPAFEKTIKRGMSTVEQSFNAKFAALEQRLSSISNDVSQSPFKAIRATDPVVGSDEYANYLKNTNDVYGQSLYDGIIAIGQSQGQDAGIKAFMACKNGFVATGNAPAQLNPSPKIQSNGGAIQPAQRTTSKQDIHKLNAEYATLVKSNLKQDMPRRLALVVKIAQLQSNT